MASVFVIVEHRQGEVSDSSLECISCAKLISGQTGMEVKALLLSDGDEGVKEFISGYAGTTLSIENQNLKDFSYPAYAAYLKKFIADSGEGSIFICAHTSFGMELLPRLSADTGLPCITDVSGIEFQDGRLVVDRSMYSDKVIARISTDASRGVLITVRSGVYQAVDRLESPGNVEKLEIEPSAEEPRSRFVSYREAPAAEVDITQTPVLLSIGRGIKDADNIPKAMEVAEKMGAVLSCSRPVVDKKWLGKERQVGTSGKTVKPRVYIAMGISGAFQHVAGIKGAGVFIAVNRDPKAPIFRVADYGAVEDMFKVLDALNEKLSEQ